jgi:hypothetical protein
MTQTNPDFYRQIGDNMRKKSPRDNHFPIIGVRSHLNCVEQSQKFRPGKTAVDKERGHIPYKKNHRVWDSGSKTWVKV